MNREDIIRMAREAGAYPAANTDRALLLMSESHLERFATVIASAEREACAKACDEMAVENGDCGATLSASAIRSRVKI